MQKNVNLTLVDLNFYKLYNDLLYNDLVVVKMHETALMQELITTVMQAVERYNVTRVNRVVLSVGKISNVLPEALLFAFEALTGEGIMKGAGLEIEYLPIIARCRACGCEYQAEGFPIVCPGCQSKNFTIISGDEVYIKNIECEEE